MRMNHHLTQTEDYEKARKLRQEASSVESRFWFELRKACKNGAIKFRRQQPIHPYIIDFACMKAKLLIELDGFSHDTNHDYDQKRDNYLRQQGYTVLRINNKDVMNNVTAVVEAVAAQAKLLLEPDV
jgi:very-short-patch-repair endonuclease